MLVIVWRASGMGGGGGEERRGHIPEHKHNMNDHIQWLHKCQDVIQLNKHPFKGDITVHQAALLPV